MTQLIDRQRFWSWDQVRRGAWAQWFGDRGVMLDDVAEFAIDEERGEVEVWVYLRDENGRRYPDEKNPGFAASETVTLFADLVDVSNLAERPGTKTVLSLPPYL